MKNVPPRAAISMPELPEVELVTRFLRKLVNGRRLVSADLIRERLAPDITTKEFARSLAGARIIEVGRRGKHILFNFDNDRTLVTHLRMSGRFMMLGADDEDPRFSHAIFHLDDGQRLVFQDQRHFGFMRLTHSHGVSDLP